MASCAWPSIAYAWTSWYWDCSSLAFSYSRIAARSSSVACATRSAGEEAAKDELEDPAMAQIFPFARGVEADAHAELAVVGAYRHFARLAVVDACDEELLATRQPERLAVLAVEELEREDAHHQEVRAVDPLIRLRDHRAHAEQVRAFRRPVAGRAGAVLLAREHDRRDAGRAVAHRRVVDRHLLAVGLMRGPCSLAALDELVAQTHVRERAAHHHLVIPPPGAVRVELAPLDAVLDEVRAGRRVGSDRARRGDVVGRHRVAEHDEAARAGDVADARRVARHALEIRRESHVRRVVRPSVEVAGRRLERSPALVAGEDVRIRAREHRALDRAGDRRVDLRPRRPEVAEEDVFPVVVLSERLGGEVEVHAAGERIRDDERRRSEVIRLHLAVDARLEVAVAGEDGADDE